MEFLHPITRQWFETRFGEPTEAQRRGWSAITRRRHTLIAAPTGSGKTLAAFLVGINDLLLEGLAGSLPDKVLALYVSPLKALSNDVERNLETPLLELTDLATRLGTPLSPIRTAVRTGDTPASRRQSMLRRPPHILVTTPESLYLLLTSSRGREILTDVRTVIVDEIHALARDKRGSHLALSLARLDHHCERPPIRIGLSATQKPLDEIARFLVGSAHVDVEGRADAEVVDVGHVRKLDLNVEVPPTELAAVCSNEQWGECYQRLVDLIEQHRSTLIFVNTRRMAERISFHLSERLGKDHVSSHHGSLSKELRHDAERRLKSGELKAIVATASLELGIDVGYVDLVCQIGSPRSIAVLLQRIGRSGHSLGATPKGRIFPLTRDDLLESLALLRAVRLGVLDAIDIPRAPLDILAQQIVATVACDTWDEDELYALCKRAWPFHDLSRHDYDEVLRVLSEPPPGGVRRGAHIHRDRIHRRLKASRAARIIAISCGGAIPDNADYPVYASPEGTLVGTVNEDFAIDSSAGDVFLLGNTSWRILAVRTMDVLVEDAHGAPPTIPFWFGEAPGRTRELSHEIAEFRREVSDRLPDEPQQDDDWSEALHWAYEQTGAPESPVQQAIAYIAAQKSAMGVVPTDRKIVFERFFDEIGGMQLIIHAPLGARINRAWGFAMRKRFCKSYNFELQASADDDGIVLSLGSQHSFPIDDLFGMLHPLNARDVLEQAILDAPLFKIRWRWNVTRSLAVLRSRAGKRVPPPLQRHRSDDMLTALFPQSTACLENRPHEIELPDHPIIRQTMTDCLFEATDLKGWLRVLEEVKQGTVQFLPRDTREPSPFSHERLNANPYAFLDDAPLEERRARMVATRRSLSVEDFHDLGRLDPEAIQAVREEALPSPRDPDELHEMLLDIHLVPREGPLPTDRWQAYWRELVGAGRATSLSIQGREFWADLERWPCIRAAHPDAQPSTSILLPVELDVAVEPASARVALVRGWLTILGPTTAEAIGSLVALPANAVESALALLETEGVAMRGTYDPALGPRQWCDRRLLARIHRRTLSDARRRIQPVDRDVFVRFLLEHHRIGQSLPNRRSSRASLLEIIRRLAGFEAPAGAWEFDLLPDRLADYSPSALDELTLAGEVGWGRLCPPASTDGERKRQNGINRVVPISLFPREDLLVLLPRDRAGAEQQARGNALLVWETLRARGALFMTDIIPLCRLLPAEVEQALGELAALGLVSADGFASIRSLVGPKPSSMRPGRRPNRSISSRAGGRWSVFPPHALEEAAPTEEEQSRHWARVLLDRYGIVFRDLLANESVAPPWWKIAHTLRRMEMRGEVHGGRFIRGVSGEQFALPGVVDTLRVLRDRAPAQDVFFVSAVDPLNLTGVLGSGPRVPAARGNTVAIHQGRFIAHQAGGEIHVEEPVEPSLRDAIDRGLRMNGLARRRVRETGQIRPEHGIHKPLEPSTGQARLF